MKQLLLILIGIPLLSFSQEKKIKNDLTKFNYKDTIKSIKVFTYKAIDKPGIIVKDSLISKSVNTFNATGFIIEQSIYKYGTILSYKKECKYDVHNNITEEKTQALAALTKFKDSLLTNRFHFTFIYNTEGNWMESKSTENGEPMDRLERKYDKNGNVEEERTYVADAFEGKRTFNYDSAGNKTIESFYRKDSALIFRYLYTYNAQGNMIELQVLRSDGSLDWKQLITYDSKGNKTEDIKYSKDAKITWDQRYEIKNSDKKGNWITEILYDKGEPQSVIERTIEYY